MGTKFGSTTGMPLLVAVRSGARDSMPGMMDTILNLGLNDESVQALARKVGNERFAYDSYRRLIQMYGSVVMDIPKSEFEEVFDGQKNKRGVKLDTELTAADLKEVIAQYKEVVRKHAGRDFPQSPTDQLTLALIALPIGLPAGVAVTLLLEAELLFALIALYGLSLRGPAGRLRLYALWAGAGFADAAKGAGLRLGANAVGRALAGSLPARIIARLNPVLLRAILRRLGLGWLPRALKMWPLLGAPVGFALDRAALRAVGFAALDVLDHAQE